MKKIAALCLISILLGSCAVTRKIDNDEIRIKFLDEYVLEADLQFENTRVGGLSGIDFSQGKYYMVSDQASNPRIYVADIEITNRQIAGISIEKLIKITNPDSACDSSLDLEAIRYDEDRDEIFVTSEGHINEGKDPGIYSLSTNGKIKTCFEIPEYFKSSGEQKPRNNGVFEGLSESFDKKSFWTATELPLEKDGPKPKIFPTRSYVRFTKFDKITGRPVSQFAYKLDGISKLPINYFAVNGVTEILEYEKDKFLVLERAYSAGYGSYGNTVKIFAVDASNATNTLELKRLRGENYQKAEKKLVFNLKSVKDKLTDNIIDNIEGITFGPVLENGNRTLILISDNNFNTYAKQINQFILLEIEFKDHNSVKNY